MKLLVFAYHFLITNIFPTIIIFLTFDGALRGGVFLVWFLTWFLSYLYIDKIILFFLGAREIIDSDFQELFQQLKSETYKRFEKQPKIYLYSGRAMKCFVFDSRSEWSVVLDRELATRLNTEQTKALVDYLVRYKKTTAAWRLTKSLGLVILTIGVIYSFWSKILMINTNSRAYKILTFFTLSLYKPFFDAILLVGKQKKGLDCDESLAPIINNIKDLNPGLDYSQFLFDHVQDHLSVKDMIIGYLESFPVVESAEIKRSY